MLPHRRHGGLARGLLAASVTLALLGSGASWHLARERDRLLADEGARLRVPATAMAERLEEGLGRWLTEARRLAANPTLRAALATPEDALGQGREVLDALQQRAPELTWVGIVRPDGTVQAATEGLLEGRNIAHRPIFRGGVEGPFLGDIHPAQMLDRLLRERRPTMNAAPIQFVDAAVPVLAPGGTMLGVVTLHIDWNWAVGQREIVLAGQPDPDPELLVVDVDGKVILGGGPELAAAPDPALLVNAPARGWVVGPDWLTATARTRSVSGHPGLGWSVAVRRRVTEVLRPLQRTRLGLAALALAGAVGAGLLAARHAPRRTALAARGN
ncbi:hypothetical protein [Muricoccus radiodurans]|uniref:hypothetical protein n=1 Tax=Muricoccus radiodurans TaxID=2231721 RepID=UPI003CFA7D5E